MTTVVNVHANDNRARVARGKPLAFPDDAVARIYRPSPSVMTSARPRRNGWRLVFERRTPPFVEPLMGYTGGNDTLTQIALSFPTLGAAIRYAERQGLTYMVDEPAELNARAADRATPSGQGADSKPAFSNATLDRLGLADVQDAYVRFKDGFDRPSEVFQSAAIAVTFSVGYPQTGDPPQSSVPAAIKAAILLLVGHWYESREAVAGGSVAEMPFAVSSLLAPYRRVGL